MELDLWLLLLLSGTTGQLSGAQHSGQNSPSPSYTQLRNMKSASTVRGRRRVMDLHSCAHRWAISREWPVWTPAEDLGPTAVILASSEDTGSRWGWEVALQGVPDLTI